MKKVIKGLCFALALIMIGQCAFAASAATLTVSSRERYTDDAGTSQVRVKGTIAFSSTYRCVTGATGPCGAAILPAQLGMTTIQQMVIEPSVAVNVGQNANGTLLFFKYHRLGNVDPQIAGIAPYSGPNIRAYYWNISTAASGTLGATSTGLTSAPSYDLSDLTAVPFEAIGV